MRHILRLLVALTAGSIALLASPAEGRRVALVIGNAEYKIGPLANPVNDAAAVADAFERQLKFDKVILKRNLGAEAFRAALLELARETAGAELGVVYFAGHGTEVGGKNFLIPVDATLAKSSALALEAIPLDAVLEQLDGVTKLRLVILDACRNNIFGLAGAKRGPTRGLARIEPERNTLVAFAAKEGTAADDGKGRHSPYTAALLKHLATPGLEINLLFRRVRVDVLATTGGAQQPAEYHSLGDKEVFLVPAVVSSGVPAPPLSDGQHKAFLTCDKLPFTSRALASEPVTLTISAGKVKYSRTVYNNDRSAVIGAEIGAGSLATDGTIALSGSFQGSGASFKVRYQGKLSEGVTTLTGKATFTYRGKTYLRACSMSLPR